MLYDTTSGPPPHGSLREVLYLVVWRHRQSLQVAGARAQAQAALGGDAALDAFKEYRDTVLRVETVDKEHKLRDALDKWQKVPEIRFTPINTKPTVSLKNVQKTPATSEEEKIRRVLKDFRPRRSS